MKVLEIEGKTVDDATKKAMNRLGNVSDINIEVIDHGKSGIFGFGVSKPAQIRVYYNENVMDVGDTAREVIETIMNKMQLEATIKDLKEGELKVYIELESKENSGLIIGRKGKTLESLQFILNLIVNYKTGSEKKIILDIEDYREKRERALRKMSKDIAQKVIKTGRPWILEPMNPFERRLIHLALQNDTRVTTKSEGQGIYRKIKIMPANYQDNA
ncbi:MAG: protein jag [Spirochaetia bacterium]|jgi:spoIIIJ-associated protein|nr:protein jag [Spirochaetia bacterium]